MNAFVFSTITKMKSHPDYLAAKGGNMEAAQRLVYDIVSKKKAEEFIRLLPPNAIIAPIKAIGGKLKERRKSATTSI